MAVTVAGVYIKKKRNDGDGGALEVGEKVDGRHANHERGL